ncbi:CehA/McbA family metallohydrolase [Paraburkholderia phenoliruptrix]|uniref:CehA/McbA family metallohydrolase n=1 Tax=Paraburkholderia phenoliruptrix TaxID=252970 RepID=UPI002869B37B|nr:CehA/McbA family metallohydrolase [Paraburkholderia phenoliruptrix]WMY10975.1 CehA/McbA family metallohydrolase [Paraburkholderia phenoliruptrix]
MNTPPSPHFAPVNLDSYFNVKRKTLDSATITGRGNTVWDNTVEGSRTLRGIPFLFGREEAENVLELRPGDPAVDIALQPASVSYVLFVHAVEDRPPVIDGSFGQVDPTTARPVQGIESGDRVSTYTLCYADGSETETSVLRRLDIQQSHTSWRLSPYRSVPALKPGVFATHAEDLAIGRAPDSDYFLAESRATTGLVRGGENLWIYALPNPHPDKEIVGIRLRAEEQASTVYAVSTTRLSEHPLRGHARRKLRMRLPDGVTLNALGELDTDDRGERIGIDLGSVISARAVLDYSEADWLSDVHDVQPTKLDREVIVEYSAHPDARLYIRRDDGTMFSHDLRSDESTRSFREKAIEAVTIEHVTRPVKLLIVEKGTGRRVAARLHLHGSDGQYLPPKGHHRKVNTGWFEDYAAEFANGLNQYAYVDGQCVIDVPVGRIFVEITGGFEVRPLRKIVDVHADTDTVTCELEKVLHWREQGWVSSDTHVHFLSPQTALLEGQAEGVNVVNLLASQWGELFTNVGDFDGSTTIGAKDFGGSGEFMVRVGTENRMDVLGHISLLGYEGDMINPLCVGGPSESAIGDALEVTMTGWAEQCRKQGGLVVLPHGPDRQAERAADIVLGVIDAVEMMTANPRHSQISAFGLADWYRYLNIGYHLPLVGGSDKMSAANLLGGIRTYVQLGEREFSYKNWMNAVRGGDTFVTVGPLVSMSVEGRRPGTEVRLAANGGRVTIDWRIESVSVPPTRIEVIKSGHVVDEVRCEGLSSEGHVTLHVTESCWLAIRVRGSVAGRDVDIAAHTSAVYVQVGDRPIFATNDAVTILQQIEGSIAYLDTIAPRSDEARHARVRASLQLAHHRLHHRLHELGATHSHTPIHSTHIERDH